MMQKHSKPFDNTPITPEQAQEAITRSGYPLELVVALRMQLANGSTPSATHPSYWYVDPASNKSRELDVYSVFVQAFEESPIEYANDCLSGVIECVKLVECKNNPNPLVLLSLKGRENVRSIQSRIFSGWPIESVRQEKKLFSDLYATDTLADNGLVHGHKFCSFLRTKNSNDPKWNATHEDPHFESLASLALACLGYADSIRLDTESEQFDSTFLRYSIVTPILVLGGPLWAGVIDPNSAECEFMPIKYGTIEIAVTSEGQARPVQIFVSTAEAIGDLVARLNHEAEDVWHALTSTTQGKKAIGLVREKAAIATIKRSASLPLSI